MRRWTTLALILICLLSFTWLPGCGGGCDYSYLNRELGRLHYDVCLLWWGKPSSLEKGENITVALWKKSESKVDCDLQLWFDKNNNLLRWEQLD